LDRSAWIGDLGGLAWIIRNLMLSGRRIPTSAIDSVDPIDLGYVQSTAVGWSDRQGREISVGE
jgi:hypothetical protein